MSDPAQAGIFIYAKDLSKLASFYQQVFGCTIQHGDDEMVAMNCNVLQLVVHRIPQDIAQGIIIESPPIKRDNTALKFFVTVDRIETTRQLARKLGGDVFDENWQGPGFIVCNAMDCEGNVFQLRETVS